MPCFKTFTFAQAQNDMPLDNAIYSASQDKIYGVRGGWIYKCNASTGKKEAEFRFAGSNLFAESSVVEVAGSLYASVWRTPNSSSVSQTDAIYKIPHDFSASTSLFSLGLNTSIEGVTLLKTDGTYIYGVVRAPSNASRGLYAIDPSDLAAIGTSDRNDNLAIGAATTSWFYDMDVDSDNGLVWLAQINRTRGLGVTLAGYPQSGNSVEELSSNPAASFQWCCGCCFCPSNTKLYGVNGTSGIVKADANLAIPTPAPMTFTTLSVLNASSKPVRIKYNSNDGLIYVPTFSNDTVEVLNPASDTISSIKAGFSSPFDVVFTPTKKFAVQTSSEGLREII